MEISGSSNKNWVSPRHLRAALVTRSRTFQPFGVCRMIKNSKHSKSFMPSKVVKLRSHPLFRHCEVQVLSNYRRGLDKVFCRQSRLNKRQDETQKATWNIVQKLVGLASLLNFDDALRYSPKNLVQPHSSHDHDSSCEHESRLPFASSGTNLELL
ncbi:hypothetical protein ACMFMG_008130 [Clarireedia jacksonii]